MYTFEQEASRERVRLYYKTKVNWIPPTPILIFADLCIITNDKRVNDESVCRFLEKTQDLHEIEMVKHVIFLLELPCTRLNFQHDSHFPSLLFSMWKNHLNPGIFSPICVSAFYLIQNVTYLKWRFICQGFIHAVKQGWIKELFI